MARGGPDHWLLAPPTGALTIFCPECRGDRPALKERRHARPAGWFNRCCECSTCYPSLPPGTPAVRQRRRMYERRSGQLLLGGRF